MGKVGKVFSPKVLSFLKISSKRFIGCKINGVALPFALYLSILYSHSPPLEGSGEATKVLPILPYPPYPVPEPVVERRLLSWSLSAVETKSKDSRSGHLKGEGDARFWNEINEALARKISAPCVGYVRGSFPACKGRDFSWSFAFLFHQGKRNRKLNLG